MNPMVSTFFFDIFSINNQSICDSDKFIVNYYVFDNIIEMF